jgi:hypothetical protein
VIPKRVFWLGVGYGAGLGTSLYAVRKVKAAARRYAPENLGERVSGTVTGISRDVRAAVSEGRSAMREREAELRRPKAASRAASPNG